MPVLNKNLPRICVALGFSQPEALARAAEHEYREGNIFLEFRLDHLSSPAKGIEVLLEFHEQYPDAFVLATCRHQRFHGHFKGDIGQQLAVLESAAKAGACALDLEIEAAELAAERTPELRALATLIVSYHNFESTPALPPLLKRLQRVPADAYKLVTTARKPSDNQRLLEWTKANTRIPLICFAMSDVGMVSRVLSPAFGCRYTYAAPDANEGTAPGQVAAHSLRTLYRIEKLSKQSRIFGVVADPVQHSLSPLIHNRAFQTRRVDAVYLPFRTPATQLGDWMKLAAALPVAGFSVTIPHKQKIGRYLDIIDPLARRIGAVNTVWRKGGKWRGTNTDVAGIVKPLSQHLSLRGSSILIVGYGGAARAAAFALQDAGSHVTITGRDSAKAQSLSKVTGAKAATLREAAANRFDALIHATPIGMSGHRNESIFNEDLPAGIIFDMVYNPRETKLLQLAKEQGRKIIYGSEMFLEQAAHQFEIWTGESAPRAAMEQALQNGLAV